MLKHRSVYRLSGLMLLLAVFVSNWVYAQQGVFLLKPAEFSAKIKALPEAVVLDVRTPEEFSKGHIENARNANWNSVDFGKSISVFDKNKAVLLYCLSGGRSASAATYMRKNGFTHVYELEGGIIKWRSEGFSETLDLAEAPLSRTLSMEQYKALLKSEKFVLVDFYADWCAPCKQMKPHIDRLAAEHGDKVKVVRINADDHKALLRDLRVDELPTLYLYKNEQITWRHIGFIDLNGLLSQLQ